MLSESDLQPYQLEAIEWMTSRDRGMLWLGLGGGKTIISLTAIARLKVPTLVVATKRIIEYTWPDEIAKWEHVQHLHYEAASGTRKHRVKAIDEEPDVLGISYENLAWFYTLHKGQQRYRLLIFDEISKMKAHDTQRLRIHRKLCTIDKRFGLTATPAPESYVGLWGQFASLGEPNPLGRNITQFRDAYVTSVYKGMYTEYRVTERDKRRIEEAVGGHTLVLQSPKREAPTLVDVPIPWKTEAAERSYRLMERKMIVELEGKSWALGSRAEVYIKCRQMATGFIYGREDSGTEVDDAKYEIIREEYESLGGDPVLVFYQFIWERDALLAALPNSEILEGDALDRFNQGQIPALICHPRSAGYGLNLQGACRHVFWATLPDSATDYIQANGRIDRQGQERQVVIKRFIRQRSIEEEVVLRLEGKLDTMEQLIERVKERQE